MISINTTQLIKDSNIALKKCTQLLESLATTCCMPERSPNMIEAQTLISGMIKTTNDIKSSNQNIDNCIETIGILGSKIGYLNATCCTATRESLYQDLFKELNIVHNTMWSLKGH